MPYLADTKGMSSEHLKSSRVDLSACSVISRENGAAQHED